MQTSPAPSVPDLGRLPCVPAPGGIIVRPDGRGNRKPRRPFPRAAGRGRSDGGPVCYTGVETDPRRERIEMPADASAPLTEVPYAAASGDIRLVYDAIAESLGVRLVNLA